MVQLRINPNEVFDIAIKRFKRMVEKDGTLKLVEERAKGYIGPSERKKIKHRKALAWLRRKENARRKRQAPKKNNNPLKP
jgi:ribosomal protein S21